MSTRDDYENVLKLVRGWPPAQRIGLAQELLAEAYRHSPRPRVPMLDRALGLLKTDGPAPSDEDVKRWIDDYRMAKYGGA